MRFRINAAHLGMAALLLLATGCKPTEAGYREAYERATAHARDKEHEDLTDEEYELLKRENAPKYRHIGQDSVPYINLALTPVTAPDAESPLREFNLAVGKFQMPTNARSLVERLKAQGFGSFMARDAERTYYVMAGASSTDTEIPLLLSRFKASGIECSGIRSPLLVITRNLRPRTDRSHARPGTTTVNPH